MIKSSSLILSLICLFLIEIQCYAISYTFDLKNRILFTLKEAKQIEQFGDGQSKEFKIQRVLKNITKHVAFLECKSKTCGPHPCENYDDFTIKKEILKSGSLRRAI